ncbi:hypothetical protein FBUS_02304 [Fasciolopsis buskii]|uniref:IST1 homolog n=1 Tax=Fasciolopsis buskii TaxID=27845 RepID=A0A8E0RYA2_9TREM|nr:hypothetical protein FBUS_02304 [Fasciolopsis buski]
MKSSNCDFAKLKSDLNVSSSRFDILIKKRVERSRDTRTVVCDYLRTDKAERAKIHVEQMIRDDSYVEALELLKVFHCTLISRMAFLQKGSGYVYILFSFLSIISTLDSQVMEAASTIIWSSTILCKEVPDYKSIVHAFKKLFGKHFVLQCLAGSSDWISVQVKQKLNLVPGPKMIEVYLVSTLL